MNYKFATTKKNLSEEKQRNFPRKEKKIQKIEFESILLLPIIKGQIQEV